MRLSLFPFCLLCLSGITCFSQSAVPATLRASMTLDRMSDANRIGTSDMLYGIPLPPGEVIGDSYLSLQWQKGNVLLNTSETLIEGYPLRYDIGKDELEIKSGKGVKALAGSKIKSFTWIDSISNTPTYFLNARDFKTETGETYAGFVELISDGSIAVFKRTSLSIKQANYVPQFDVGSRDDKIMKNEEFFYLKSNTLIPLPSSKKKLSDVFGDRTEEVKRFMDVNSMRLKEEHHIKAIFDYYNSKVKS